MKQLITRNDALNLRKEGKKLALVPTMGALHAGHLSLVEAANQHCEQVVVSIFVNPKQFGAGEDFSRYPRTLEADMALLEKAGVDYVFTPTVDALYPQGFATTLSVRGLDNMLCGAHRPGHFDGVCTVVGLLFSLFRPYQAFFGEKDYQQLAIIRRMNEDMLLAGEVIGVPTLREADGLAMSSRNRYLSEEERTSAPVLYQTLQWIKEQAGLRPLPELLEAGKKRIIAAGFASIDYLEARHHHSLALVDSTTSARLLIAARIGDTRLIDNISL